MSSSGDYGPPSDPWGEAPDGWDPATGGWSPSPPPGSPGTPGTPPGHPPMGAAAGLPGGPPPGPDPARPGSPYPPPPRTVPPYQPPPPPRRSLGLYAVVAVLVLLAAGGAGYALYLLSGEDGGPGANPTSGPTPAGQVTGTASPGASPGDNIGLSAAAAREDDCLVNDGTAEQTQMRIVRCEDDDRPEGTVVFRVLAVVEQRVAGESNDARHDSAQQICDAAADAYTHHYFEIGDESSFVLCMAQEE